MPKVRIRTSTAMFSKTFERDDTALMSRTKGRGSFKVHELQRGPSRVVFGYRTSAERKGYEEVCLEDKTAMMKAAEANAARFRRKPGATENLRAAGTK